MRIKAFAVLMAIIAISITTGSAIAQTTTGAHECINVAQQEQSETSYRLTNNCSAVIRINGRDESNGLCLAFDSQEGEGGELAENEVAVNGTFDITAPAQICVEYSSSATQTASGYPGCGTISDCGSSTNAITEAHPEKQNANIVLSPSGSLDIDEGASDTFTVALSAAPIGSATVTLSKTNADITLSPTSLTFTSADYSTAQTVTVSVAQDDDAVDDKDTITLSAGGGIDAADVTKSVAVDDDDLPSGNIVVTPSEALTIEEGGKTDLTIALSARPNATTTVTLTNTNADITLSETSLTFTSDNYSTAQTVTVSAAQDDDATDDQDTITLSASGGISAAEVTKSVSVEDDDVPSGNIVILSPPGELTIEEGGSANMRIALSAAPNADTTVTLTRTNADITFSLPDASPSETSLSEISLTFTSTNYSTAQIVVVSAAHDDDATYDEDTITLSASGGFSAADVTKSVSVEDDEPPPGSILLSPAGALSVDEGDSAELSVTLSAVPNDDTTVTLSKTNADITLSSTSLTFTPDDYDQPQTVTVSAAEDDDTVDDRDTITLSASGGLDADDASKPIIVDDDDAPTAPEGEITVIPTGDLTIGEGDALGLRVALSVAPNADATVVITKTNADIVVSPASLTFTVDNYDEAQSVTLRAAEDDDTVDDQDTITLSVSGGIDAANVNRSVTISDDDRPPSGLIVLAPSREILVKEGERGSLAVGLSVAPISEVSVTFSSLDPDITLSPESLTFTTANYNQAQFVTVAVGQDDDIVDEEAQVTFTASGGIVAPSETVAVLIEDDDGPSEEIITSVASLKIEEGGSGTFTVRLNTEPTANVIVSLSFSTLLGQQKITISPPSLAFTNENWSTAQTVTLSTEQDSDDSSYAAQMILSASDGYLAENASVFVEVNDGAPGLKMLITPQDQVEIYEGDSFQYRVSLNSSPGSTSIMTFSPDSTNITVEPYFLTFTPDNFFEEQIMTVTALADDDLIHNNYEFKAQLGPDAYAGVITRQIRVLDRTQPEPEGPFLSLQAADGGRPAVNEGETKQFHVLLGFQPEAEVTVSLSTDNPEVITLNTSEISIPRDDWQRPYVFDVSAAADDDAQNVDVRVNATSTVAGREDGASLAIVVKDTTGAEWAQQAQAPAIPPSNSLDHATLRVRCKQDTDCDAYLFCTSQDGDVFEGVLDPIPANGTLTLTASEIEEITSGSWSGKGRLNCEIRGSGALEAQVWTRSGDGVLVNNSPVIVSRPVEDLHVASIDSISSPLTNEITNVRIRCNAALGEVCTNTNLYCYDDTGILRQVELGTIDRYSVRHLQSSELAELISYVWRGLGLSCDATSEQPFSVQVLTRTGSGALVNNSGCN